MSYITRSATVTMTDTECLMEALSSSGCDHYVLEGTSSINVTVAGQIGTIRKSHAHWSYTYTSYTDRPGWNLRAFDTWIQSLKTLYNSAVAEKKARVEEERRRQAEIARKKKEAAEMIEKEGDNLRRESLESAKQRERGAAERIASLDRDLEQSRAAMADAEARLASVSESNMAYVEATSQEIKERGARGGWVLARDVQDSGTRKTHLQLRRKATN